MSAVATVCAWMDEYCSYSMRVDVIAMCIDLERTKGATMVSIVLVAGNVILR